MAPIIDIQFSRVGKKPRRNLLVAFGYSLADVHRRQQRKDVSLEEHDQQFKHADHEEEQERSKTGRDVERAGDLEHEVGATQGEEHEEQVASEHVREETQAQSHWANHDGREELEWHDQEQDRTGDASRHTLVLEVAEDPVDFHTCADVNDPSNNRERNSKTELRERRELDERNQTDVVVHQNDGEERKQEGHKGEKFLGADAVASDRVTDDAVNQFASVLETSRHYFCLARRCPEEQPNRESAEGKHQHRLGDIDDRCL